jgi:hypothetical protein
MAMLLCICNHAEEYAMKRTTIMLPVDLKLKAERKAEKMGISLGELIRLSLKTQVGKKIDTVQDDPFLSDNAVFSGNVPDDLSLNHDKYLYGDKE